MKNTSLISGCSAVDVPMTSYGASDEHPMSTRSASYERRWNSRGWKYVAMIFAVLVMSVGQMWGADPTWSVAVSEQASSDFLGKYKTGGGDSIIITSTATYSSGAVQIGTVATAYDQQYIEILSKDVYIDSISFKLSGNGDNKSLQSPVFGWGSAPSSNTADTYRYPASAQTSAKNNYASAVWFTYDLSSSDVKYLRLYKGTKNISSTSPSYTGTSTALGGANTIKVWGIKVWLRSSGGGATTHTVTAATNNASYGSASAASTTVAEGGTTTVTATPNTGYRFVSWAVSGTGSTLSSTSTNPTTLTMGTANTTVTATFEAIPSHTITYTNTKSMDNSANPTSYYEGVGVASFTKLRHVVGYDFTGWSPSFISSSATTDQTIDAQWTARAAATGTGTLTYALAFGTSTITTSSITRNNGALYDATNISTANTSFVSGGEAPGNGCSGKLATTSSKSGSNYVELTFKIADGYTFTPSGVSIRANAVSNNKTLEVELKDNAASPHTKSVTAELAAGSTSGGVTYNLDFSSSPVTLEGTVTLKIYVYGSDGATKGWRIGPSVIVNGTVAVEEVCETAPTVTAASNSSVAATTATVTCSGGISDLGDCDITSYGFVLGTSENPTISDTQHQVGTSYTTEDVSFSKDLTGLTAGTTYYVRPYVTNGAGTAYGTQTSFTTSADVTAPTLDSSSPEDEEINVPISGNIELTFSENVTIADASKFTLTGGAGTLNTASASASGAVVTIPYSGLANSITYTLSIAAGAVQDAAGNTFAALSSISFTTAAAPIYYYKDATHYVSSTYKNPEGNAPEDDTDATIDLTTPWTICSACKTGVTSVVANGCKWDNKSGTDYKWISAYIKVPKGGNESTQNITITLASGYTGTLSVKIGGYSSNPTVTLQPLVDAALGSAISMTTGYATVGGVATKENNFNELRWPLATAGGTYVLTVTSQNAYISQIEITTKQAATAQTVTATPAGGGICSGSAATIGLEGSQSGVNYQLYRGSTAVGDPVAGTGSALELTDTITTPGTYTVKSVENSSYAVATMTGSVTVSILAATEISTQPTTSVNAYTEAEFTLGSGMVVAGSGLSYQWYSYTSSEGAGEAALDGKTAATMTDTKTVAGTYYYKVKVTGSCGDPVYSNMITVTVTAANTLTYNANGGTGTMSNTVGGGSVTLRTNTFTYSGYTFLGWATSDERADAGTVDYADGVSYTLSADATLYAVWAENCYSMVVNTSGSAPAVNDAVGGTQSGGTMKVQALSSAGSMVYGGNGIKFNATGDVIEVTLLNKMQAGTIVSFTMYRGSESNSSGLKLLNSSGTQVQAMTWDAAGAETRTIQYKVVADDGLDGSKVFRIGRNNTVWLKSVTVANCAPITYDLTVAVNNGEYGSVDKSSVTDIPENTTTSSSSNTFTVNGTTVTATPTTATAEYTYAFSSWSGLPSMVTANATVTANFTRTANSYTLAWNTNGGNDLAGSPTTGTTAFGTALTKPTDPTKSNYTFAGWNTANDGSGTNYTGAMTMPATDATYYAQWTQAVTLDANTANHGSGANQSATAVWNATGLTGFVATAAATDYAVIGYFTDATGGTQILNADGTFAADDISGYVTGGKWSRTDAAPTLYAHLQQAVQVTYNGNGDDGTGSVPNDANDYKEGDAVTVLGNTGDLAKTDKVFNGWNTAADGTGTFYPVGSTLIMPGEDVTLYAVWNSTTETTYYLGSAKITDGALVKSTSGSVQFFTKSGGIVATNNDISFASNPGKKGYEYKSDDLSQAALSTSSNWNTGTSSNCYIQPVKFESSSTYTLKLGSRVATSIVYYGYSASASKTLTIDGETFTASSTKQTFETHEFTKTGGFTGNVTISSNGEFDCILVITAYALDDVYDVTFDANTTADVSGMPEEIVNVPTGSKISEPLAVPTRTGYTFHSWCTDEEGTSPFNFSTGTITAATTLYAKWTPIDYNVNYVTPTNGSYTISVASGEAGSATKNANYEQTITLVANPASTSYAFSRWTIKKASDDTDSTNAVSLSGQTATATFTMPAYSVMVEATFADAYALTYDANGVTAANMPSTEYHGAGSTTLSASVPTADDCVFLGWSTATDGSTDDYTYIAAGGAFTMPAEAEVLYAQWGPKVTTPAAAESFTLATGRKATLTVAATTCSGSLSYQWYKDGVEIGDAITTDYVIDGTDLTAGTDYAYTCRVSTDAHHYTISPAITVTGIAECGWEVIAGATRTSGAKTVASYEGSMYSSATFNVSNDGKINSNNYVSLTLTSGNYFQNGDTVAVTVTTANDRGDNGLHIFVGTSTPGTEIGTLAYANTSANAVNKVVLANVPAETSSITIHRSTGTTEQNWYVDAISVSRYSCPGTNESKVAGNWDNPTVWAAGKVPTVNDRVYIDRELTVNTTAAKAKEVVIMDGGKLIVAPNQALVVTGMITNAEGNPTTAAELKVESSDAGNGTLIFNNSNHAAATVQMYSKAAIVGSTWFWQYMASPYVSSNGYNYYGSYLYSWGNGDGTTTGWYSVPTGGAVTPWTAYCITSKTADNSYNMEGELVATDGNDQRITIPANSSWVVGNSWTAPIQIGQLQDADFDGLLKNVYLYNTGNAVDATATMNDESSLSSDEARYAANTYISIPIHSGPYTGISVISSLQGFFVKDDMSTEGGGTLHLRYADHVRPTGGNSVVNGPMHAQRRLDMDDSSEPNVLKIKVCGSKYDDRVILLEREDFSMGYDAGWDGDKMGDIAASPRLTAIRDDGTEDAVSAVSDFEGMVLNYRSANTDNEQTLYFEYSDEADPLYIVDVTNNVYTRVVTGNSYRFTTSDNTNHVRFILTRNYAPSVTTGNLTPTLSQGEGANARKLMIDGILYIIREGRIYTAEGALVK